MSIYTSVLTGGSNNHETTSESANGVATDFVQEGVVGTITNTSGVAPATGAFAVNAQGTPNMTVAVSAGYAYVTATPSGQASQTLRVYNNATATVTHAANSSGSTKYDWIYISVDAANAANPNTAGDNVATLVTSRSSSSSSDDGTPPTYGYPIAVVTVANGASSITNGNIADKRTATGVVPADGGVTLPKLLFTPTTQANAGTAGGTMTYMDLGGVKILWGLSSNTLADGTGGTNYTWTLPTSYFTTIQHVSSGVTKQITVAGHIAPVDAFTTTTVTIKAQTLSGSGSHQHSILVIGT